MMEARVRDLWQNGFGWLLPQIAPYVTDSIRLWLASVVVDDVMGARDRVSWGPAQDGEFSAKSAYAFLTVTTALSKICTHSSTLFGVPRCNKGFSLRRRGVYSAGIMGLPAMEGIWRRIVPPRRGVEFFASPLLSCLNLKLENTDDMRGYQWATVFAMDTWWGWKWWKSPQHTQKQGIQAVWGIKSRDISHEGEYGRGISGNPGLATAGGVVRDGDGPMIGSGGRLEDSGGFLSVRDQ
ncbi:unnamed protein product [Microthlaspi erraticum]|uniref:Uncharacterized protein n=1 Tax=Microthlaspi erraticum TaxID=1685480 RepID=A0A6D2JGN7_9BRAS|nr:unnamed protein product [Microthlaspi erraticum]